MSESYCALRWLGARGVVTPAHLYQRRIALLLSSVPAEEQDAVQEFVAPREPQEEEEEEEDQSRCPCQ